MIIIIMKVCLQKEKLNIIIIIMKVCLQREKTESNSGIGK